MLIKLSTVRILTEPLRFRPNCWSASRTRPTASELDASGRYVKVLHVVESRLRRPVVPWVKEMLFRFTQPIIE